MPKLASWDCCYLLIEKLFISNIRPKIKNVGSFFGLDLWISICVFETIIRVDLLISEKELLTMVRAVSEDQIYDTIEFNEFLQMMSKQQKDGMNEDSLKDAFR